MVKDGNMITYSPVKVGPAAYYDKPISYDEQAHTSLLYQVIEL